MEVYSTELRKLEKCLRTLKSEPKDEKTVMALRNYNAVLKSLANLKTKIREFKVSEHKNFKASIRQVTEKRIMLDELVIYCT